MARSKDEILRTYKVGLRIPESLLREQNELGIELEVLNHIRKRLRRKPSQLVSGKLRNAPREISKKYKKAEEKYRFVRTVRQANMDIARVRHAITQLHWKSPTLNFNHFKRTQVVVQFE